MVDYDDDEEDQLRSVSLQNAASILLARQKAEAELMQAKVELERKTDELREEARILELLNETAALLSSTLDLQTLIQFVTDKATELCTAEFGAFFYTQRDEQGQLMQLYTLSGAPRDAFDKFGHPRATPLFGATFKGEKPIRSGDIRKDPRYGRMAPHYGMPAGHLPVCSYLAVPVITRSGEVIGSMFFGHAEPDIFNERAERLIVGIAGQAAMAIENARLYDNLRQAVEAERLARAEAERVNRVKDEFLLTLSHELRTPLNSILGWSQILLEGNCTEDDFAPGLASIVRNAKSQAQLIDDLLDMSSILSGKVKIDVKKIDALEIMEGTIAAIKPSVDAKGIRLDKALDSAAGPVMGDAGRLQQMFWNLLSNAVKFTPKGGSINVRMEQLNSNLLVTVKDSGIGINPEFLPFVFDRFRQGDSSLTRRYGGLGLGLSIVKHLVELHGGSIQAESPGVNLGATFILVLPVAPYHSSRNQGYKPSVKIPAAPPVDSYLNGIKVLVVDDEKDTRELIKKVLSYSQASVMTAPDAVQGLELLKTEKPDVLISDIGMPEYDGYQFIGEVRKLEPSAGGMIPAVALTAFAHADDRSRAMLAGYQVHMAKPVEPLELIAAVASLAAPVVRSSP